MQQQINFKDLIALGFKAERYKDSVHFDTHGNDPMFVTLDLTEEIYLNWDETTRACTMIRIDNERDCNIIGRLPMNTLDEVKAMVEFWKGKNAVRSEDESEKDWIISDYKPTCGQVRSNSPIIQTP